MEKFDGLAETRLASYGSLRPGEMNHEQLAGLKGRWYRGTVRGNRFDSGWGSTLGYPGLVLDEAGPEVEVQVFESADLPDHWKRLDEFEGPEYRRVIARIRTDGGYVSAYIYVVTANIP